MDRHDDINRDEEPLADGLGELPLGALALPAAPPGFEDRLWRLTSVQVRGRARRRRLILAAALVLAYAAGAGTFALAGREGPSLSAPAAPASPPIEATAPKAGPSAGPPPTSRSPEALAADLKRRGDRLLSDDGDVQAALACYRQHLELASLHGAAQPDPQDSWLLAALKQDRP